MQSIGSRSRAKQYLLRVIALCVTALCTRTNVAFGQAQPPTQTPSTPPIAPPSAPPIAPMASAIPARTLTRALFLAEVLRTNATLAAERTNVPLAQAQITIARILPDPSITVGVTSLDVSRVGAQNSIAAGVSIPLEWPGRLGARVDVATVESQVAMAGFEDTLRAMRTAAGLAFIEALAAKAELVVRRQSLDSLERFVAANMVRLRAGDIGEVPLIQARVEEERYRAEVVSAEGEALATTVALRGFLGSSPSNERIEPAGELRAEPILIDEEALIARALSERADLRSLRLSVRAANARIDLARINRGVDIVLGLGWQYYTPGEQGSAFQAPPYHTLAATVTVPLPFSRINRGNLSSVALGSDQAAARVRAGELQVENEVRQAVIRYRAAITALSVYDRGLLRDAERVVESILYSYQRGSATLLEVLAAQRTLDDVRHGLVGALAAAARAKVFLETSIGTELLVR